MKKLYTLAFMAIAATSVSASGNTAVVKKALASDETITAVRTTAVIDAPRHAPAKAADYSGENWESLGTGKYVASAVAGCYGGTTDPVDVEVYEAQGKSGLYKVVGVWADILGSNNGELYIDATDPEFVLVRDQYTGINDDIDGVTHIATLSAVAVDNYGFTKADFMANFAAQNAYVNNGIVHFPIGSLVLGWPEAPADSKYETDPEEWYDYSKNAGMLVLPGAEYVDPWGEPVDATMVETILQPLFLDNTDTTPFAVKVQKNSETGAYRIIEPWSKLYLSLGFQSTSPNIEIDATDPSNLVIELQGLGISGGTDGSYQLLSLSYLDLINERETADEFKITLTENADGTSTITFPYRSTRVYATNSKKTYYASEHSTPSTITFKTFSAGVDDIISDSNADAPVEYFNLQGVRVTNPAAGQLIIKRQGSEVTKMIVR